MSDQTDENLVQLISYAEDALHSMPYHLSVQYVQRCVTLTSQMWVLVHLLPAKWCIIWINRLDN